MNWKEAFYTGKREHPQEEKPASLTALLMPSLLGVAICLVCLCSLTSVSYTHLPRASWYCLISSAPGNSP